MKKEVIKDKINEKIREFKHIFIRIKYLWLFWYEDLEKRTGLAKLKKEWQNGEKT